MLKNSMAHGGQFIAVQRRGLLALPKGVRSRLGLDRPGAQVEVVEREDGVIELHPHVAVPADQAWFWTERWQRMEREVDEHVEQGEVTTFESSADFLSSLEGGE
jgi:bifunctional DNA-binding transcriptional regulator/antitoxin component of YhaV-PrlF toxin-antitoxin module